VLYLNRADYTNAQLNFQKALEMDPTNAKAYSSLGMIAYQSKNYALAVDNFKKAVNNDPKCIEAFYNLGCVYFNKTKDIAKALDYFQKVIALNPRHELAYTNAGLCYEQTGDYKNAIKSYLQAISLAPGIAWTQIARDHVNKLLKLYAAEPETKKEGF
jgi:superkiller protein 3